MKKTKLRKNGLSSMSKLQKTLWAECKRITRKWYGNTCYTCGKTGLKSQDWHTGHLWPKASLGAFLKYDIRILRPQCYHCNMNLGGNGAIFYKKMLEEHGKLYMQELENDRDAIVRAADHYEELLRQYKEIP